MKKRIVGVVTAILLFGLPFQNPASAVQSGNPNMFPLSETLADYIAQKAEPEEPDMELFDKYLKYNLCITNKEALSAEKMNLCETAFVTERSFPGYMQCPYVRETFRNSEAPERLTLEEANAVCGIPANCIPDILFCTSAGTGISEYWLDDGGKERIISYSDETFYYQASFDENPDIAELDRRIALLDGSFNMPEEQDDGSYLFVCRIWGYREPAPVPPAENFTSGIWQYTVLDDGSAQITACLLPNNTEAQMEELILPTELDGHEVSGIICKMHELEITKLVIPENYRLISPMFCLDMPNLQEVEIQAPELTVPSGCFDQCPELETVLLNVRTIEPHAFISCENLKQVNISGANEIAFRAFAALPALSSVTLPENLQRIGQDAFLDTALTELVIPRNVQIIGVLMPPTFNHWLGEVSDPLTETAVTDTLGAEYIRIADENCVLRGFSGTEAERYAAENKCLFSALKDALPGDLNGDGTFSIADAVLLQKWLTCESDAVLNNWTAADLTADGQLNTADLTLLKRELLKQEH